MVDTPASRRPAFMKPAFLSTEFNDFLFASIGADATGTYLTVVSALARLDLDPWTEAADLARMPGGLATQKLAALISRFPEILPVRVDSTKIAARLTALLPGTLGGKTPAPGLGVPAVHAAAQTLMAPRFIFLLMSISLSVMLATQLIVAQGHPAEQIKAAQTVARLNAPIQISPGGCKPSKAQN